MLQKETLKQAEILDGKTMAHQSHYLGACNDEPLLFAMDGMLRYAKAYKQHFEGNLADDNVLGECWLDTVKGIRGLLDGDGAVAMERNITTDSKDNGVIEGVFWDALKVAGFTDTDL